MELDLVLFAQRIFDALFNSSIYASLALALVIIFRSTGLLNFAQGEMATFCAYVAFVLLVGGAPGITGGGLASVIPGVPLPTALAVVGAVAFGAAMGSATERFIVRPLANAPELSVVNVTIGLLIAINALMAVWWTTNPRAFPALFPASPDDFVDVAGARLRYSAIGAWLLLGVLLALLALLLTKTKAGLAFRAVASDRASAALMGVPVNRMLNYGWALAAAFGALAACLSANTVLLEPNMMLRILVYAFAAATLGGLDSPKGALVGGLIIGLSHTLVPAYVPFIGFELGVLPPLLVMVGVLLVRPAGLFGTRQVERV